MTPRTWMTGLITSTRAGPIPRQNPANPSFLRMACAASIADSLTLRTVLSPSTGVPAFSTSVASAYVFGTMTACADCAVWTVQMGLVVSVVIDPIVTRDSSEAAPGRGLPAMRPARMPSAVVSACGAVEVCARRRSKTDRASSSVRQMGMASWVPRRTEAIVHPVGDDDPQKTATKTRVQSGQAFGLPCLLQRVFETLHMSSTSLFQSQSGEGIGRKSGRRREIGNGRGLPTVSPVLPVWTGRPLAWRGLPMG